MALQAISTRASRGDRNIHVIHGAGITALKPQIRPIFDKDPVWKAFSYGIKGQYSAAWIPGRHPNIRKKHYRL